MAILVIGAAGYLGRHICASLHDGGQEVVALDRNVRSIRNRFRCMSVIEADVREADRLREELDCLGIDRVIYLATTTDATGCLGAPGGSLYDFLALRSAMALARSLRVERFLFASSVAVYGNTGIDGATESTPPRPSTLYGRLKLCQEELLRRISRDTHVSVVVLRVANVVGCRGSLGDQRETGTKALVPSLLDACMNGEGFSLFGTDYPTGDGSAIRDFVCVDDVVDALEKALHLAGTNGQYHVVNIGTGVARSVLDVLATVTSVTGKSVVTRRAERRVGDLWRAVANCTAAGELEWKPQGTFRDAVASAWDSRLAKTVLANQ